ncbi:MAG: DUF624 domain-containing protein [Oscillospiraceae bacterium]|nr:DUF624 domain-containing protein [Oscillospiraceae bacterium]
MDNNGMHESKFWKVINLAGNAIALNLMFLVSCIPIITIGPAMSGLFSGVRYMIRGDGWFAGFKTGFRNHFLRTSIASIVSIAMMVYLMWYFNIGLNFYFDGGSVTHMITYGVAMLFPSMIAAALWPLNVYIPYSTTDWLRNAVNLICKAPLQVLVSAAGMWLPVFVTLYWPELAFLGFLIIIAIYFSLIAFASTMLLKESLIKLLLQYRTDHPDEEC